MILERGFPRSPHVVKPCLSCFETALRFCQPCRTLWEQAVATTGYRKRVQVTMALPSEPICLPAREELGDVSHPAEEMEPDPLLGSQKTQKEQNSEAHVVPIPSQSGRRDTTGAAGCLAGLKPWAHHWAVQSLVLNLVLILLLLLLLLLFLLTILILMTRPVSLPGSFPAVQGPACPDGWVGYRRKCFYFSEAEGNWTDSRSRCSALGASLAGIDNKQEMDFMQRYKGKSDYWIGLRRDPGQPWEWTNGTKFNEFGIGGDGDCAYLNEKGVSSLRCTSERHWICSKPDELIVAKETPAGRGS